MVDGFLARIGVAVEFVRRSRVLVLQLAHCHASLVVGLGALSTVCVDALFGKVVGATAGGNEDAPTVAGEGIAVRSGRAGQGKRKRTRLI